MWVDGKLVVNNFIVVADPQVIPFLRRAMEED